MAEENVTIVEAVEAVENTEAPAQKTNERKFNRNQKGPKTRRDNKPEKVSDGIDKKMVNVNRISKTVKGGRNMRFTALVVVGDGNGHVGAGLGKATEIPEAIRKGKEDAMKKLITVKLDENNSITHDISGKHTGASVLLKRAPEGTGVIAGGPARNVCELAGIENIRTKSLGSNNKQNVVLATIDALSKLKSPEEVAKLRGLSVEEVVG